ncbi:glycosyltransferase family 2 protein [Clostridium baratii]|uniref:glycosyltransferase family 2 protein n=1 Tax=Clostridium baratii TaxID=1561 RepID=UPI003D3584B6
MGKIDITVFTTTYNRGYTLERLYNSLKRQTHKNFEWIIIDDGSLDNTESIVKGFILENLVDIKYIRQENSGKHIAINNGVEQASGELFFIVDSDDYLTINSLELILKVWNSIEEKNSFIGVGGRKLIKNSESKSFNFKEKYYDADSINFNLKYKNFQDKAEVFETEKLKKYKFKQFKDEKFMTEAVVWYRMSEDGYKIRWFNEDIYICEYLSDGLTSNYYRQRINSIDSTCYSYNLLSSYKVPLKFKFRYKINYFRYGLHKYNKKYLYKNLKNKSFWRISFIIGKSLKSVDKIIHK